jgi:hypothetical protein
MRLRSSAAARENNSVPIKASFFQTRGGCAERQRRNSAEILSARILARRATEIFITHVAHLMRRRSGEKSEKFNFILVSWPVEKNQHFLLN